MHDEDQRHQTVTDELQVHNSQLHDHERRLVKVEKNVFPKRPLWALVLVITLIAFILVALVSVVATH